MSQSPDAQNASLENLPEAFGALTSMLRAGRSFSGRERNRCFLNTHARSEAGARFADISATSGLDFPDDARAVAQVDWDADGDLDLWVSNRNAPRLRLMRNDSSPDSGNRFLAIRLVGNGTTTNRDAVGARVVVELEPGAAPLVKTLRAGEGFLAQSSKWLHFGLGRATRITRVSVRWPGPPGGEMETFSGLDVDGRYELVQGSGAARRLTAQRTALALAPGAPEIPAPSALTAVPFGIRLPVPTLRYQGFDGATRTLPDGDRAALLVNLWSRTCAPCVAELAEFAKRSAELERAGIDVLALSTDGLDGGGFDPVASAQLLARLKFPFAVGRATPELLGGFEERIAYLMPIRKQLPLPTSFLIDARGRLAILYKGQVGVDRLIADTAGLDKANHADRLAAPLDHELSGRHIEHPLISRRRESVEAYTRFQVAEGLRRVGRFPEAVAQFEAALELKPNSARMHNNLALVLRRQGEHGRATQHYQEALRIDPQSGKIHNNFGALLLEQQQLDLAQAQFERALSLTPDYPDAEMNLGVLCERRNDPLGAQRHYANALRIDPKLVAAEINLGLLAERGRDFKSARQRYENALAIEPDHADAHNNLGVVCAKLGDLPNSVSHVQRAIEIDPNFAAAHNNLGIILESQGRFADARASYEAALRINPDYRDAQQNLANLLRLMRSR